MKSTNRDTFSQDVLGSNKIVLLDVWAPFCAPCRGLGPIIEAIYEENKEWLDVVKFDASVDMEFVQGLGVSGLPAFFVYKDGKVIGSIAGATTKAKIEEMLQKAKKS